MVKGKKKKGIIKGKTKKHSKGLFAIKMIQAIMVICACIILALIAQEEWRRDYALREVARLAEVMDATPKPTKLFNTSPEKTILPTPSPSPTPIPTPSPEPIPIPTPAPTPTPRPIDPKYNDLLDQNSDFIGWIKIEETVVNYPVTQYIPDNEYYLHRDFLGNDSKWGTIYVDSSSRYEPLGNHIILYGHRMADGSMFKPLISYNSKSFFDTHDTIIFNTLYEDMEWEIFSINLGYWEDIAKYDDSFENSEEWLTFIQGLQNESIHDTSSIELKEDDIVISLITCTYEFKDARFFVHARLKKN